MRPFLMILTGFALTSGSFASGAVATVIFLAAEPVRIQSPGVDAAEIWPSNPVRVDSTAHNHERVPAKPVPKQELVAAASLDAVKLPNSQMIDATTTGSISTEAMPSPQRKANPVLNPDHVEWCANRYRSYRPRDNSYTPYSGGRRECVSPYSKAVGADEDVSPVPGNEDSFSEEVVEASFSQGQLASAEHIESCFARYRSYRPEDNTYQPYGGGPRRQCR